MPRKPRKETIEERSARLGRSAKSILNLDALRKRIYDDRKQRQVCVDCEGELAEDDGVRCGVCTEEERIAKHMYRLTPRGAAKRKKAQRTMVRGRYDRGLCVTCATPREKWGEPTELQKKRQATRVRPPQKCPDCVKHATERQRKQNEERRAGVISIVSRKERKERNAKLLREMKREVAGYEPIDEQLARAGTKILRALHRMEWATAEEIFEACGLADYDEDDYAERNTYQKRLSRHVDRGLVERRDLIDRSRSLGAKYQYRLADAGRAVLKQRLAS